MKDPSPFGLDPDILGAGDEVLQISGRPARDPLDFHYYTSLGRTARLKVRKKNGSFKNIRIDTRLLQQLDVTFSPMEFKRCRCKCPFCFVEQMPKGMRRSLYVRDEDYRLSFLYANYTTMNDIADTEIEKIVEQNLSPQYVSVHAVDDKVREWMFGRPMKRRILDTLRRLAEGGITIHAQVVLCPGKNDGRCLDETIERLAGLHPNMSSLAVVPVGLTRHRKGLPEIKTYEGVEMEAIVEQVEAYQAKFLNGARGSRFVFLSDEWYIGADRNIPDEETYEDFPQLDNGVGMTRSFLREIEEDIHRCGLPGSLGEITILTGALGEVVFRKYVEPMVSSLIDAPPNIISVRNRFFGDSVTCSGLLVFEDVLDALRRAPHNARSVFLPPNILNHDGRFLDGPAPRDLERSIGCRVVVPNGSFIGELSQPYNRGGLNA